MDRIDIITNKKKFTSYFNEEWINPEGYRFTVLKRTNDKIAVIDLTKNEIFSPFSRTIFKK